MNLGRHSISSTNPVQIFDARFDADCKIFTTSAPAGFAIYRTYPLQLIRKRGTWVLHQTFDSHHLTSSHRVGWWNSYLGFTFTCHKHSLSIGWRSESSVSSKQSYPVERYSGQGSGRTRIQRKSKGTSMSPRMACSILAKESRRISNWRIHDKIWRMGYV